MRAVAIGIVVAVSALAAAVPAAASTDEHIDEWSTLGGSGLLTQACPATGTAGTAAYEIRDGVVRVLGDDGVALSDHSLPGSGAWPLAARYTMEGTGDPGRGIDRVVVTDAVGVRLEVLVDRATSVPLALTSFEPDGSIHCTFAFIEWEPGAGGEAPEPAGETVGDLPAELAGFVLGSTVAGDGFVAGLYGDGVFTFSLTAWDGTFEVEGTGGGPFGAAEPGPARSLLAWQVDDRTLVMIGDLPLDLRETVVSELPEPDAPGFFLRLWRRLFG